MIKFKADLWQITVNETLITKKGKEIMTTTKNEYPGPDVSYTGLPTTEKELDELFEKMFGLTSDQIQMCIDKIPGFKLADVGDNKKYSKKYLLEIIKKS